MIFRPILTALFLTYALPAAQAAPPFTAIELHDGGHVIVRNGPAQRVNLSPGAAKHANVTVSANGALVIRGCRQNCPRGFKLNVEIVTPSIARILVSDGGSIAIATPFPAQPTLTAVVNSGGIIDARALRAEAATAQVRSGGVILLRAEHTLDASVVDGGRIVYWGRPAARTFIDRGGAIEKGEPAQENTPLSEFNPPLAPPPNVPPLPPRPPN